MENNPTHEEIAHLAYHLWLAGGQPIGTEKSDWRTAEKILQGVIYELHYGGIAYTITSKIIGILYCKANSHIALRCNSYDVAFFIEDGSGERILQFPQHETVAQREGFCTISCVSLYRDPLLFELDVMVTPEKANDNNQNQN